MGSTVTNYLLDTASGLSQVLADGINTYLYGLGRISQSSASSKEYYLGDALGSVRQLVNASGGIVLSRNYEPYGTIYGAMGNESTAYGFTNEWTDGTGLINLRARYYAPVSGRFMSTDPWKGNQNQPISYNKWAYAYANPIMFTDPTGNNPAVVLAAVLPSLIGLGAGIAVGAIAGATLGACTYEWAIAGKCGCEIQKQAMSMTKWDWIGTNSLSGGLIGGFAGTLASAGPAGIIVLGVVGATVSVVDLLPAINELKTTGITWCTATRIILDVAGIVFGATGIVKGVRAWRTSGNAFVWSASLPPDIASNFEGGNYDGRYLKKDILVYRAEGKRFGQWYGSTKPDSAAMAEKLYNVAIYGNDILEVSTYRIPKGTFVFEGAVKGGSGWQYYIPDPIKSGIELLITEPLPQFGY